MLNQLREDHANMAGMLHVLKLKQKTLKAGERPDFHLVREVVDYILDYMDGFSQLLENVFSQLIREKAPDAEEASALLTEHYLQVKEQLKRLSADLDMILMDAVLPMDRFADDLDGYLEAHQSYLREEREHLMPLINKHFDEQDMQRFATALPEGASNQFEQLKEAYPELEEDLRGVSPPSM
jgi:hemerythrin-like domain-containing protein